MPKLNNNVKYRRRSSSSSEDFLFSSLVYRFYFDWWFFRLYLAEKDVLKIYRREETLFRWKRGSKSLRSGIKKYKRKLRRNKVRKIGYKARKEGLSALSTQLTLKEKFSKVIFTLAKYS